MPSCGTTSRESPWVSSALVPSWCSLAIFQQLQPVSGRRLLQETLDEAMGLKELVRIELKQHESARSTDPICWTSCITAESSSRRGST